MLKLLLLEDKREDSVAIERALFQVPEELEVIKASSVQDGIDHGVARYCQDCSCGYKNGRCDGKPERDGAVV